MFPNHGKTRFTLAIMPNVKSWSSEPLAAQTSSGAPSRLLHHDERKAKRGL
jgi:hypothetical protein